MCDNIDCANGGVCQPIGNSFRCNCPIGWTGTRCRVNIDECSSAPCQNGGQCLDNEGMFFCNLLVRKSALTFE